MKFKPKDKEEIKNWKEAYLISYKKYFFETKKAEEATENNDEIYYEQKSLFTKTVSSTSIPITTKEVAEETEKIQQMAM